MRIGARASRMTATALAAGLLFGACGSSSHHTTSSPTTGNGSSSSTSPGPSGTPLVVGVVGTGSGPQASSSNQYETVGPAWADWVNANGGINGHPVKVITEDDQGSSATALSQVETLIDNDKVVAIVVASDNEVSAFDGVAIAKGVPLVSGAANATDWLTKVGMFPTPTGVVDGLADQVAVAAKFGGSKKLANLYCAEIAACQQANPIMQGVAKQAGVGFTSLAVSSTAPSYTAQCIQLQQEKVDYAVMSFTASAAIKFVQNCQAQGYNPTWGTSEQSIDNQFLSLPNFTAFSAGYAFPSTADAAPVAAFRDAMGKYASNGNWREGTGSFTWDGLQAVAAALKTAAPAGTTPTAAQVAAALYGLKGSTLGGLLPNPIAWVQGKPAGFTYGPCYFVEEVKGGKLLAPDGLTPQCPSA